MRGKLLLGFLLLLPLAGAMQPLAAADAVPAAAPAQRFERGIFWRIEAPGIRPSHLLGTLHVDDDRIHALSPTIRQAFAQASGFALELLNEDSAIRRYRSAMRTNAPQWLDGLDAEERRALAAAFAERGLSPAATAPFKPWAALLVLLNPPGTSGIILDHALLLDAQKQRKTITELENIDEQIAIFDEMPEATQLALLRRAISRQDQLREATRALATDYLAADLAAMWRTNLAAMGEDPALADHNAIFLDRLLFERNERFAERLEPLLRKGRLFAAFGALHLHGVRGVPALLAARGWRVTPLR